MDIVHKQSWVAGLEVVYILGFRLLTLEDLVRFLDWVTNGVYIAKIGVYGTLDLEAFEAQSDIHGLVVHSDHFLWDLHVAVLVVFILFLSEEEGVKRRRIVSLLHDRDVLIQTG